MRDRYLRYEWTSDGEGKTIDRRSVTDNKPAELESDMLKNGYSRTEMADNPYDEGHIGRW